jgi:all-trans-retinol 13,14-reductase
MNDTFDVIIVGAGLSGLLTGAMLSNQNLKVCILEKNTQIGGNIQPFRRQGYTFDTGMHFFGAVNSGQIQNEIFKIAGIENNLNISKEIKGFKAYINNKLYEIPIGFTTYENRLIEYFPDESAGIKQYISKIKEIINGLTVYSIYSQSDKLIYLETGAEDFIASITKNDDLRKLLMFNDILYNGYNNSCSLYLHAVITGSFLLSTGEFYEGTEQLINILRAKILSNSGKIETSKKVIGYEISDNKVISCTTDDNCKYTGENFVFSGHPSLLTNNEFHNLLHPFLKKRIKRIKNSPGAFSIYVILKKNKFNYLETPVFFKQYNSNVYSFLLHTPQLNMVDNYANTLKIMTLMNIDEIPDYKEYEAYKRTKKYQEYKREKAEEIFEIIERKFNGFKESIKDYYTSSPLTIMDFCGSPEGSAYGIIHDYKNYSVSSLSVKTKLQNFFLTGQNINFHGMTGVSVTAVLTCSAILNKNIYL